MLTSRVLRAVAFPGALAVLVAACASSDPAGDVAAGPAPGDAVRIEIDDDRFLDTTIEVGERGAVTFEVTNRDGGSHDFAVRSQGLNTGTLESGAVATARIVVGDEPITFVCTFHMRGVIVPVTSVESATPFGG